MAEPYRQHGYHSWLKCSVCGVTSPRVKSTAGEPKCDDAVLCARGREGKPFTNEVWLTRGRDGID